MDHEIGVRLVEKGIHLVRSKEPFDVVLGEIIGSGRESMPSTAWAALAGTDLERDVDALNPWLVQMMTGAPRHIDAIWFGLYEDTERELRASTTRTVLELSGGAGFADGSDWLFKQDWYPGVPAPTPGLGDLLARAGSEDQEVRSLIAYAVVFVYALGLVAATLDASDPVQLLGDRQRLGIAVGHHDGDIAVLGVLDAAGLDRSTIGWA